MKSIKCKDLGGACDLEFRANTFEEVAELSKQHGVEVYQQQDAAHLKAMSAMQELMKTPEDMQKWFESKKNMFETLPDD